MDNTELARELLAERRKDRRAGLIKTAVFALLGLAYLVVVVGASGAFDELTGEEKKPYAAMVRVKGLIADGKDASYEKLAPALRRAFEDTEAKGVVLLINSPGGTPVQAGLLHDLVVQLKAKHNKPVIAVGEDLMTSGAYMIAASADRIYANRSTVAGSIGVISASFGFTEAMKKVGVERRVATAGDSKNLLDPFSEKDEAGVAKQRELLEDIHAQFQDLVKTGRGARLKQDTEGLFEGSVWTGERARDIGLVDEIGSIDSAIAKEFQVETTVAYGARKPLLEGLLSRLGVQIIGGLVPEVSGPQPWLVQP